MNGPGFIFWGLFVVFGIIVAAYIVWMVWVERPPAAREEPANGEKN